MGSECEGPPITTRATAVYEEAVAAAVCEPIRGHAKPRAHGVEGAGECRGRKVAQAELVVQPEAQWLDWQ